MLPRLQLLHAGEFTEGKKRWVFSQALRYEVTEWVTMQLHRLLY